MLEFCFPFVFVSLLNQFIQSNPGSLHIHIKYLDIGLADVDVFPNFFFQVELLITRG